MEMMVSDGTANLANLRTAVPSAPCQDSAAAGETSRGPEVPIISTALVLTLIPARSAYQRGLDEIDCGAIQRGSLRWFAA